MIELTILFKSGMEKVHHIPLKDALEDMTEEQKFEAVDGFSKLFAELDSVRFSEGTTHRVHVSTEDVVHVDIRIKED